MTREALTHLLLKSAHLLQAGGQSGAPECSLPRPKHTRTPMPTHTHAHTHLYTHIPLYPAQLDSLPGEAFLALLSLLSGLLLIPFSMQFKSSL